MGHHTGLRQAPKTTSLGAEHAGPGQPGVIGIALAAVLAAALAQGSWQWFSTYIGVTLLALIFTFHRLPARTPGPGSAYLRSLAAYSLVVGLCVAITLAPALQRWAWLFPMPGTRAACPAVGRYEGIRVEAALAHLAGRDGVALAHAQAAQSHVAVADCLSATTTVWLPVYGAGAAVLTGLCAWSLDRARTRRAAVTTPAPAPAPADRNG
ncbi:hypothetical protein HEK616_65210 [Streptomyces nigrescens]|uniref:Integral membrane protein n=1 Tax=Streptomyces nigrescens TaxID=1920 RepID=A0ABN6R3N7_STRNI|nr:hypothetical protein [Streptomyces nigrescens]BDM73034.1 hypothetical protein HEK616_65210 [Streptomyces nigrescens]